LSDIDKRISDLRDEKTQIEGVYKKLAKFLHANAILPINDDILEYIRHFIREEQMKKNADVVQGLEQMMKDYTEEMELFKKAIEKEKDPSNSRDILQPDGIFPLVGTLYRLPINGKKIREQVDGLKITQADISSKREIFVELPAKANSSKVMREFIDALA
jgi:vacuolar-type H+-ATPase subunit F/Vma7